MKIGLHSLIWKWKGLDNSVASLQNWCYYKQKNPQKSINSPSLFLLAEKKAFFLVGSSYRDTPGSVGSSHQFGKYERGLVEPISYFCCLQTCVLSFSPPVIPGNLYSVNKWFHIWSYHQKLFPFWPLQLLGLVQHTNVLALCEDCTGKYCEIRSFKACCLYFDTSPLLLVIGWGYKHLKILTYVFSCSFSTGSCCLVQWANFIYCFIEKILNIWLFFPYSGVVPWFIYHAQLKSIFISVLVFSTMEPESFINTNECIFAHCWNEVVLNPF